MINGRKKQNGTGYELLDGSATAMAGFAMPKAASLDSDDAERKEGDKSSPADSLSLHDVVKTSRTKLSDVHDEFNGGRLTRANNPTYYSWWFGTVLQPNEYYMAHVDNKPVLVPPSADGLGVAIRWFAWSWLYNLFGLIKVVKQTDEFYGAFDKHVLNVQPGRYAKMYTSEGPVLYGPGTHVIKDPNCRTRLDGSAGRPETVNATDAYIQHGNVHILNVPQGKVAKVIVDGVYKLLEGSSKPYVFHSSRFEVDLQRYLVDANSSCITHGPIKRLLPDEAQVYIVSRGGKFEVIKTQDDRQPIRLDSPLDIVIGALPMGLHTPKFPSKHLEDYRVAHERMPITDAAYNFYTTRDGLRLGLKIVATFKIKDPLALVKSLPVHDVKGSDQGVAIIEHLNQRLHKHIESLIEARLQFAITHTESTDFLPNMREIADEKARDGRSPLVSVAREPASFVLPATSPTAPEDMPHALLEVQNQLREEFAKIGIELGNLLIDQIKIDPQVQAAMAQLALRTKELENDRILADRKQNLELQQAQQRKLVSEKDADTRLAVAHKDAEAKQTLANVYEKTPALVQLEMAAMMRDAMKGANATFIVGNTSGASCQPFSFFPTATGTLPAPGRVLDEKAQQLRT